MIRMGLDSCPWVVILPRDAAESELRDHPVHERSRDRRNEGGPPHPRRPHAAQERQEDPGLELRVAGALNAMANLRALCDHAQERVEAGIRQAIDRPPAEGGERDLSSEARPPSPLVRRRCMARSPRT